MTKTRVGSWLFPAWTRILLDGPDPHALTYTGLLGKGLNVALTASPIRQFRIIRRGRAGVPRAPAAAQAAPVRPARKRGQPEKRTVLVLQPSKPDQPETSMVPVSQAKWIATPFLSPAADALTEIDRHFRQTGRAIVALTVQEILDEEIAGKLV